MKLKILIIIAFLIIWIKFRESKNNSHISKKQVPIYFDENLFKNYESQPCNSVKNSAKQKCDSTLILIFGKYNFKQNIKWNKSKNFF